MNSNSDVRRRQFLRTLGAAAPMMSFAVKGNAATQNVQVPRWSCFETQFEGPGSGNPYLTVSIGAEFRYQHRTVRVDGFYDGEGVYRIRFMPDTVGDWEFTTFSNRTELTGKKGSFRCVPPSSGNHGPVQVAHTFHFSYADGLPYVPVGTTCYAWAHQGDELEEQTLATLRTAPFNKMRMCIFPKSYVYNENEPRYYPFPRSASGVNDYSQFNPEFFRHLEKRITQLGELGIEADLILFHPYDRWGYTEMPADVNDRYLRYVVARFAAYRNVWWSVANEYDLVKSKTMTDWDRFFRILRESDPYSHLRSVHHSKVMYDHAKSWVTHVSTQDDNFTRTGELLKTYGKPVIYDECKYEGNIPRRWGNISAEEMVRRFWLGFTVGAYVGHGETYLDLHHILWWSKGGILHGQSAPRIAFLRKILEDGPPEGLNPTTEYYQSAGQSGKYYLFYLDVHQPAEYVFELAENSKYRADLIDPWEMKISAVGGVFTGKFSLRLPGKPYQAVRFQKL